ncbi:MAG: ankyrin repeat domain-containing protein [Candidatus Liptonbacteria bacterium]|nr:ankyrin repeat domain-containing protein [Candidatus Liptonbacteria bacterium]
MNDDTMQIAEMNVTSVDTNEGGELVEILKRKEGDILFSPHSFLSLRGKNGLTLLHLAVAAENEAVVVALLGAGMDIDVKSEYGTTPLMVAAAMHSELMLALLVERGADERATNHFGLSAELYHKLGGLRPVSDPSE